MPYEQIQAIPVLAADALSDVIPAPPGSDVPTTVKELAREVPPRLKWVATLTPWAIREGDVQWNPVRQPPAMNVEAYSLSDALLAKIGRELFTLELPFVAALFAKPPLLSELEGALMGVPYEVARVDAMYSQLDASAIPRPIYLVWFQKVGTEAVRYRNSIEKAVRWLGGHLVYAQQVPVSGTTKRPPPRVSFSEARVEHALAKDRREVAR